MFDFSKVKKMSGSSKVENMHGSSCAKAKRSNGAFNTDINNDGGLRDETEGG